MDGALGAGLTVAQIIELNKAKAGNGTGALTAADVQRLVTKAKIDTTDEASAYFLHTMLLAIQTLADGNKLVAGRAMDDALTHFLADLKAELGDSFAANAAALLIRNISLFLPASQRGMVLAALDVAP